MNYIVYYYIFYFRNAHRIYGRHRLALALLNWEVIDMSVDDFAGPVDIWNEEMFGYHHNQPIFVLKKKLIKYLN